MDFALTLSGVVAFFYQSVVLVAACFLTGRAFSRFFPIRIPLDWGLCLPIGFCLLSALVPWVGLLQIGKIPWLVEAIGLVLFVWGVQNFVRHFRQGLARLSTAHWLALITPAFALTLVALGKRCYLYGGLNTNDDFRTFVIVSSFANSGLMPGFPFDGSAPMSYSYGAFAVAGLLYRFVHGWMFPSTPVLVVNLFLSSMFYRMLYVLCRHTFGAANHLKSFAIVAAVVTFYGYDFMMVPIQWAHIEWWNRYPINQISTYHTVAIQYLWAGICVVTGLFFGDRFLKTADKSAALAFSLLFVSAALSGAITFVWGCVCVPMVALVVWRDSSEKPSLSTLLQSTTQTLKYVLPLVFVLLLPHFFTYYDRDTLFQLSWPRFWESREFVFSDKPGLQVFSQALSDLFLDIGPFLILALIASFSKVLSQPKEGNGKLTSFLSAVVCGSLMFTFTFSPFFDWTTRGFLVATIALPFVFTEVVLTYWKFWTHPLVLISSLALLTPQIANFTVECHNRSISCFAPHPSAVKINQELPLGSYVQALTRNQVDLVGYAGRGLITQAHENQLYTYLNRDRFLNEVVEWKARFQPCQKTRFAASTPDGRYYTLDATANAVEHRCGSSGPESLARIPANKPQDRQDSTPARPYPVSPVRASVSPGIEKNRD